MPITVGYWDIRGLAEPIRYLLHYKKIEFEDKRYPFSHYETWMKEKFSMGFDFPNLPYYIEGDDIKLTQSLTILRYLAQKHGLEGRDQKERLRASLVEQQLIDLRWYMIRVVIDSEFEKLKKEFEEKAPTLLKLLADFLGTKKFLVSDEVTYVDFIAYDTIDFYRMFVPGILNEFPTLKSYQERVIGLPELQDYVTSSTYKRWPIFGPIAKFGFNGEEPNVE